jgi:protein pelota
MKLVRKNLDKKGSGSVSLIAENAEDMWHAYNLIHAGDYLKSTTIRKVVTESSVGLTTTNRVHTTLTILVKSLDFDTQASVLRVKGTNCEENQFVKLGAYHTIDLELNRKFEISKHEWDSVALERIDDACDPSQNADVAAVVMQEGLAHVCLILSSMTLVKSKIEMTIPRKRKGQCATHDKSMEKFFERIVQALLTHINFDVVKAIVIASPGFIKDQFFQYMNDYTVKNLPTTKVLADNKSKFILIHSANGFKHSLKDIFEDPNLMPRLTDTKAMGEVKALDAFYQMLKSEPDRAYYGYKHVEKAHEAEAIDVLLISDSLFRSKELKERKKYVNIVDRVRENNGTVKIFSSLHVSGEQLMQLTGIAAILRFPMPDIEEDELTDSDEEENKNDIMKSNGHLVNIEDIEDPEDDNNENVVEPKANIKHNNNLLNSDLKPNNSTVQPSVSNLGATAVVSNSNFTASLAPPLASSSKLAPTSANKNKNKRFTNKENYDDDDYDMAYYSSNNKSGYNSNRRQNNNNYYDDDDYDF